MLARTKKTPVLRTGVAKIFFTKLLFFFFSFVVFLFLRAALFLFRTFRLLFFAFPRFLFFLGTAPAGITCGERSLNTRDGDAQCESDDINDFLHRPVIYSSSFFCQIGAGQAILKTGKNCDLKLYCSDNEYRFGQIFAYQ